MYACMHVCALSWDHASSWFDLIIIIMLTARRSYTPIHTHPKKTRYNKLCGHITKLTAKLKALKPEDEFRIKMTDEVGGLAE